MVKLSELLNNSCIRSILQDYLAGDLPADHEGEVALAGYVWDTSFVDGTGATIYDSHKGGQRLTGWPALLKWVLDKAGSKYPGPYTADVLHDLQDPSVGCPSVNTELLWLVTKGVQVEYKTSSSRGYKLFYVKGEAPKAVTEDIARRSKALELKHNKDEVSGAKDAREARKMLADELSHYATDRYKITAFAKVLGVTIPEEAWTPREEVDEEGNKGVEGDWSLQCRICEQFLEEPFGGEVIRTYGVEEARGGVQGAENRLANALRELENAKKNLAARKALEARLTEAGLPDRDAAWEAYGRSLLGLVKDDIAVILVSEDKGSRMHQLAKAVGQLGIDRIIKGR